MDKNILVGLLGIAAPVIVILIIALIVCSKQDTTPCSRKQELALSDVEAWKAKSNELQSSLDACAFAAVNKAQGK